MSSAETAAVDSNLTFAKRSDLLLSLALLGVLVVLLIPLPPVLLDLLLAGNLGITILLLLITLGATQPLELAVFPSLLLLMTLYRLSLNVATTRLILLDGDAGRIVSTFGGYVVGGNLVVGLVIFLILIIIQFVVITKGSGRVSEVAARFTLDAMPGKQMAIDAELSSGSIDESEARHRRQHLTREAEFYGAMDGASKFVRGDAIAGLVITAINLVGGVILGLTHGLTALEAVRRYSILTVGDGLVSQIPALIVATTAGILVTKAASKVSLGHEIGTQLLSNHRPLFIGAGILALVGLTPGLPKLPFLLLSGGLILALRTMRSNAAKNKPKPKSEAPTRPREEQQLDQFLQTDRACLEIGARLIPLVESKRTKGLADRIASLRSELTRKHGLWIPSIRIRDNIQLESDAYRILIGGREVARGQLRPDCLLAIDPGGTRLAIEGEETADPAFGLPALWILPGERQRAELGGFTVVDASSVLITHLGEVLRRYAHELLSREDLQKLIDKVKETAPTVVDEIKPDVLRMGALHQVVVSLLQERVPITNMTRILETVASHAPQIKDVFVLVEKVREDLGRDICDRFREEGGRVRVIVLDPHLEMALRDTLHERNLALQPAQLERLIVRISDEWQKASVAGKEAAVLSDSTLRRPLRRALERAIADLPVIAYAEIPSDLLIEPMAMLRVEDVFREPVASRQDASFAPPASVADEINASLAAA